MIEAKETTSTIPDDDLKGKIVDKAMLDITLKTKETIAINFDKVSNEDAVDKSLYKFLISMTLPGSKI